MKISTVIVTVLILLAWATPESQEVRADNGILASTILTTGVTASSKRRVNLAAQETEAYRQVLLGAGHQDIATTGGATKLQAFFQDVFELVAPSDIEFLFLDSDIGSGTGSTGYTTRGRTVTLTNSPTWEGTGVELSAAAASSVSWTPEATWLDVVYGYGTWLLATPTGPNPASSSGAIQVRGSAGSLQFLRFGQSGTGGASNFILQHLTDDGNRYASAIVSYAFYRNKAVEIIVPRTPASARSRASGATTLTTTSTFASSQPAAGGLLTIDSATGDASCRAHVVAVVASSVTMTNELGAALTLAYKTHIENLTGLP